MGILATTLTLTFLKRGLYVLGLGLMISLSTMAIVKTAIAGSIVLSQAIWWGVIVGLAYSWLCTVAGIVLAVRGLIMLVKK